MDQELVLPDEKPLCLDSDNKDNSFVEEKEDDDNLSDVSMISTESLSQLSDLDEAEAKAIENYCWSEKNDEKKSF